jgi:hypothetical protein
MLPKLAIVVPDQKAQVFTERGGFAQLLSDPAIRRGAGNGEVDNPS